MQKNATIRDNSLICDKNAIISYFICISIDLTMALNNFYAFTVCMPLSIVIDVCGTCSNELKMMLETIFELISNDIRIDRNG